MVLWKQYHIADDLSDALGVLSGTDEDARLIAGGTDLLIDLQQGRHPPVKLLVDITNIPELNRLEVQGDKLFIGAAVPLNRLVESTLLLEHAQALVEACMLIGGPQVRNTATLGGNVAHALPAADGTIALMALNAIALVADASGVHQRPLADLFVGPGRSGLHPKKEILVGFHVGCRYLHQASRFARVMRPQGVALPILNIAVWIQREGEVIRDVHVAVGPSGPVPRRATGAEEFLKGSTPSKETIGVAYQALLDQMSFRSSPLRASADYRKHLSKILFSSAVITAFERAVN